MPVDMSDTVGRMGDGTTGDRHERFLFEGAFLVGILLNSLAALAGTVGKVQVGIRLILDI